MAAPDVLSIINRGGFGRVEQVRLANGEIAARKVFDPGPALAGADISKLRARFRREVRIQSTIAVEFVVPVIEHHLEDAPPWFAMPLAAKNYGDQITAEKAAGFVSVEPLADILDGLEELHRLGYTHRDLKPQNVLLLDGHWRLSDFGLALPPTGTTTKLTSVDSAWGTLHYCAPEQATHFSGSTPAVDIYAFGCILHDIYGSTPRIPYQRHSAPGPIGRVIEKCTELSPAKRFKNVAALRAALLSILATPQKIPPTPQAQQWIAELPDIATWSNEKAEEFADYLAARGGSLG